MLYFYISPHEAQYIILLVLKLDIYIYCLHGAVYSYFYYFFAFYFIMF